MDGLESSWSFTLAILLTEMEFYVGYPPNGTKVLHRLTSEPRWDFTLVDLEPRWDFTQAILKQIEILHQSSRTFMDIFMANLYKPKDIFSYRRNSKIKIETS